MDENEYNEDEAALENEEEEEVLDPNNPDHEYAIIERDYTKTSTEMEQNPDLIQYSDELTKIFEAFYKAHQKQKDLEDECEELEGKLANEEQELHVANKLIRSDERTITELKDQIRHAWKMADNAHAREQTAQEIIDNLRKQIDSLNAEIDFKNKMGQDNEEAGAVSKHKEGLQRERDKLASEVAKLSEKLGNALSYQEELERRTSQADLKINEISEQLEDRSSEIDRVKRQKDKLEHEIKEMTETAEKKDSEFATLTDQYHTSQKLVSKLETNLKEQKNTMDKLTKDSDVLNTKYCKMQDDFDSLTYNNEKLKKEFTKKTNEIRMKDEEGTRLKNDLSKTTKAKDFLELRMKQMEDEKGEIIQEREKLRQQIGNMAREIDLIKRQNDTDRRNLEHMSREKDIMNKNIVRQQAVARDHIKLIKIQEQARRKLVSEIDNHVVEGNKKLKQISYLEKEKDRLMEEQLNLTKKIEDIMDEAKLKKAEIYDLKKSLAERDNKLRMQINLFEAVRSDRNALQKSLLESNAECSELKTKLKVTNHQTEQLKEDIAMKEQTLTKAEMILRKVTKEKENLRVEVDNGLENIRNLKQELAEMKAEEKRLHKVIMNGDRLIRQQSKDLEQLMNERDILGSQLVRRNDELSLLYEKITILQTTLQRGEAQYEQRLEDIRLLKVEIKRLRQEKNLLTKSISNMTDLRQEVFHLERELTRERLKSKALEEELQHPMNIHRWRKLEGTDPETYELLQKMRLLQKRILFLSAQALDRERQLKETERLYLNLRQVVGRQPGPELQTLLTKTQHALTANINKMKCLTSELNMTELQAKEYKFDFDKVSEELKQIKKKYTAVKKAHSKHLARLKETSSKMSNQSQSPDVKFTGGGFRMSVTSVNN